MKDQLTALCQKLPCDYAEVRIQESTLDQHPLRAAASWRTSASAPSAAAACACS